MVGFGPGYDSNFVGSRVGPPVDTRDDSYEYQGSTTLEYTHFSLALSRSRRLPIWVAWNIDGGRLLEKATRTDHFRPDPRLPPDTQTLGAFYENNDLDRGHIARVKDLGWGEQTEALRAMDESFYFTNITPQMKIFNESTAVGLWGGLESAILNQKTLNGGRVTVMGGPVLTAADPAYGDRLLPRDFWKVLVYRLDDQLRARAFVLTQDLSPLSKGVSPLDAFALYERELGLIEDAAGIAFDAVLKQPGVNDAPGTRSFPMITDLNQIEW